MRLVSFLLLLGIFGSACSTFSFSANRLIQFDKQSKAYGSRNVEVNFLAASHKQENILRRAVFLPFESANLAEFTKISSRSPGAVFITMPSTLQNPPESWIELEKFWITTEVKFPVYFVESNESITSLEKDLLETSPSESLLNSLFSSSHGFQVIVPGPEPKVMKDLVMTNIYSILQGINTNSDRKSIAIVANYDTFSLAPGFKAGANTNAASVAALFTLAKTFSRLYHSEGTRGKFDLLFVLTSGGSVHYEGTKEFIQSLESRTSDRIAYALCLDSIVSKQGETNLIMSRNPQSNPFLQELATEFEKTAKERNIPFEFIQKKVNLSSPHVSWEHEHFSKEKIATGTFTSRKSAVEGERFTSLFDSSESLDYQQLYDRVQLVSDVLFKIIYNLGGADIGLNESSESKTIQIAYMKSWVEFLVSSSRFPSQQEAVIKALDSELSKFTKDPTKKTYKLNNNAVGYAFFENNQQTKKVEIFTTKSAVFDVVLSLSILSYLAVIYVGLVGRDKAQSEFFHVFKAA